MMRSLRAHVMLFVCMVTLACIGSACRSGQVGEPLAPTRATGTREDPAPAQAELILGIVSQPRWCHFSHDGRTLVLADFGRHIQVWDADSLELRTAFDLPPMLAGLPALADEALLLAYGSFSDSKIRLLRAGTGEELLAFSPADKCLRALALSSDGKQLASGSYRHHEDVRIWDTSTGEEVDIVHGGPTKAPATAVAFDPHCSAHLVLGYADGAVRFHHINGGTYDLRPSPEHWMRPEVSSALPAADRTITGVAISGVLRAASGPESGVWVWRERSAHGVELVPEHGPGGRPEDPLLVALQHWEERVAVAQCDGTVRVRNLATQAEVALWQWPDEPQHENRPIGALRCTREGDLIAAGLAHALTSVWRLASEPTPRPLAPTATPEAMVPVAVAFEADGRLTAIRARASSLRWWVEAHQGRPFPERRSPTDRVTWSARGPTIEETGCEIGSAWAFQIDARNMLLLTLDARREGNGISHVYSLVDGSLIATLPISNPCELREAAVDTAGRLLAFPTHRQVRVIRLADGHETASFDLDEAGLEPIRTVALSGDGSTLAADCGKLLVLNVETREELARFPERGVIASDLMALSPTGDRLAIGHYGGGIIVYESASGQLLGSGYSAHSPQVLRFSPDGRILAVGCSDGHVALHDARNGSLLHDMAAHDDAVTSVAFGPGGGLIVSVGRDGRTVLASTATGERVADLLLVKGPGVEKGGWLVVTPRGSYDGSPEAIEACVRFRVGAELKPASDFPTYHKPDLLARALRGELEE
jgi:WD40 repeat protein